MKQQIYKNCLECILKQPTYDCNIHSEYYDEHDYYIKTSNYKINLGRRSYKTSSILDFIINYKHDTSLDIIVVLHDFKRYLSLQKEFKNLILNKFNKLNDDKFIKYYNSLRNNVTFLPLSHYELEPNLHKRKVDIVIFDECESDIIYNRAISLGNNIK